ncbi:MAG TPA: CpXC domain-containing protein [bacterium]|nr:CpXC domain-containing protein [bacterium]
MLGSETDVTCACGHTFKAWIWQSANVTRTPELRQAILEGNMNVVTCPSCGARFHVEVRFLYHDMKRQEWIWVYPLSYAGDAAAASAEVDAMWRQVGETMPPGIRKNIEGTYKTMVVFGMDALVSHLRSQEGKARLRDKTAAVSRKKPPASS